MYVYMYVCMEWRFYSLINQSVSAYMYICVYGMANLICGVKNVMNCSVSACLCMYVCMYVCMA